MNIEDWVSRQTGQPNEPFLVREPCSTLAFMTAKSRIPTGANYEGMTCVPAASGGAVQEQLQRALSLGQSRLVRLLGLL